MLFLSLSLFTLPTSSFVLLCLPKKQNKTKYKKNIKRKTKTNNRHNKHKRHKNHRKRENRQKKNSLFWLTIFGKNTTQMANDPDAENSVDLEALQERLQSITRVVRQAQTQTLSPDTVDPNNTPPVAKAEQTSSASENSESKAPAIDDLSLDNEDDDENRNKR